VDRKSPAWLAGLREGDEILRAQDRPVVSLRETLRALQGLPAGRTVRLMARRGAVEMAVEFAAPSDKTAAAGGKAKPPAHASRLGRRKCGRPSNSASIAGSSRTNPRAVCAR